MRYLSLIILFTFPMLAIGQIWRCSGANMANVESFYYSHENGDIFYVKRSISGVVYRTILAPKYVSDSALLLSTPEKAMLNYSLKKKSVNDSTIEFIVNGKKFYSLNDQKLFENYPKDYLLYTIDIKTNGDSVEIIPIGLSNNKKLFLMDDLYANQVHVKVGEEFSSLIEQNNFIYLDEFILFNFRCENLEEFEKNPMKCFEEYFKLKEMEVTFEVYKNCRKLKKGLGEKMYLDYLKIREIRRVM